MYAGIFVQVGQTLNASTGVWTQSPTSYTYQWNRDGIAISGAVAATYVAVSADVGHAITVTVIATNGGGSSAPSVSAPTSAVVLLAFYVATTGNDSNAGTVGAPFLTLHKAQLAMQGGSTKATYIRAGTYTMPTVTNCGGQGTTCGLDLEGSADNGETWSYYPPDGVDSAILDCGSTSSSTGLYDCIYHSVTTLTINGLTIKKFKYGGVDSSGGSSNVTLTNNIITNGYTPGGSGNPGAITCYGCGTFTITNNVIHDIAAFGISVVNVNGSISNLNVANNVVYLTCTATSDCGGIYAQDTTATATNLKWTNNFVRDANAFATHGSGFGAGLYADDCLSNLTATGNIVMGNFGSQGTLTHGGNTDHFNGNIIDLTSFAQTIAAYQTSSQTGCSAGTMSGNQFEHNVVIGGGGGGGYNLLSGSPGNSPTITNNDYHNYAGSAISHTGNYTDASPSSQDPSLSSWVYIMSPTSLVLSAPVSFPAIVGGWGPPGYAIPETGTLPSYP